ncbi:MAG: DUF2333 family protein [Deltaproteobacteria bacterium]|nr:DUF2333 family protein [Deltaproteobacteria bacterium]
MSSEQQPDQLPVPLPPEPPPPPPGLLKRLLVHRLFLVVLVLLIFLAAMFILGGDRRPEGPSGLPRVGPETATGLQPTETAKPASPEAAKPRETDKPGEALQPLGETPKTGAPPTTLQPLGSRPEAVKGEVFTRALIKIIDDQVNQVLFGWRPNTILFGKLRLTDNVNNRQLGVLEVGRRTIVVLNENMTRFAVTEAYNPQVNEAMNFIMVSPDKYWFPSASGKYREAIQLLETYLEDLRAGRSRFYTRVDNLIALLGTYKDILGSGYHNLSKDKEADGNRVSWFKTDDYFYFNQGLALGLSAMLEAVKEEFRPELTKKGSQKLLDDAIHALQTASQLNPWLVTNGAKDGILANHRANMSTYIGEAEHLVATLHTVLATN